MGETTLASPRDNAAISRNPGLLALVERFDWAAQFGLGPTGDLSWAVSGVDSRQSEYFALGFAYAGAVREPPIEVDELPGWALPEAEVRNLQRDHDFHVGVAGHAMKRRFSYGVGGNVSIYGHDRYGRGWTGDADAGVAFAVSNRVAVGLAANNVLPIGPLDDPLSVGGGVRYEGLEKGGAVELDAAWVDAPNSELPLDVNAGLEAPIRTVRLRAGGLHRGEDASMWGTAGIGFEDGGAALEYAFGVPLQGEISLSSTTHTVGLRFGAAGPAEEDPR